MSLEVLLWEHCLITLQTFLFLLPPTRHIHFSLLLPKFKACFVYSVNCDSQVLFQAKLTRFKLSFDRAATYVFPFMFFLFNAGYWTVYLVIMPNFIQYGIPEWTSCSNLAGLPSHHHICITLNTFHKKKYCKLMHWWWWGGGGGFLNSQEGRLCTLKT